MSVCIFSEEGCGRKFKLCECVCFFYLCSIGGSTFFFASGKLVKVHSTCTCQFRSNVSSHQIATLPAVDMSRRKVTSYGRVAYQRLPGNDTVDFVDAQFEKPAVQIPWKSIFLASVLCFGGTILLLVGSLLVTGHIEAKYADRTWPLLILGSIMFLPGAYHIRIAYCAFRRYPGYSFDDIPEFD